MYVPSRSAAFRTDLIFNHNWEDRRARKSVLCRIMPPCPVAIPVAKVTGSAGPATYSRRKTADAEAMLQLQARLVG
jgi:hypothetical protein